METFVLLIWKLLIPRLNSTVEKCTF